MATNLSKFEKDLDALIDEGYHVELSLLKLVAPDKIRKGIALSPGVKTAEVEKNFSEIKDFKDVYQHWYSEALVLLKQLLPDRVADFVKHYESPRRTELNRLNYRIEDCLQGLSRGTAPNFIASSADALPHFRQQIAILTSAKKRFASSLFDIRQLVQADLLDSELEAAETLLKYKYTRAAGAVSGVVLERHLGEVCSAHNVKSKNKHPSIADFNELLKTNGHIDTPTWRHIQMLGDIRNLCDHSNKDEPTKEKVHDLIDGVKKIIKTVF